MLNISEECNCVYTVEIAESECILTLIEKDTKYPKSSFDFCAGEFAMNQDFDATFFHHAPIKDVTVPNTPLIDSLEFPIWHPFTHEQDVHFICTFVSNVMFMLINIFGLVSASYFSTLLLKSDE